MEQIQSSVIAVSSKRQDWREATILGRAGGPVRKPAAYLRKALPEFIANELQEIGQWLVGRLVENIDTKHPTIEGMKAFLRQAAGEHDLPLRDDLIESIIEIGYFKWKARVQASGMCGTAPGQKAGM